MYKEAIISIITVVCIITLNIFTGNYTKESVSELTGKLTQLKEEMTEDNIKDDYIHNKIDDIYDIWDERYNVLAYYQQHNELEKVQIELVSLRSAVDTQKYDSAINKIDESISLLKNVQETSSFNLKNIF